MYQHRTSDAEEDPDVIDIRLFGGVRAERGGAPMDLGPAKCQALLAALALSAGASVPVGRLIEMVWAGEPPRTAEKTLQSYVTRLRKALGAESIQRVGAAYRLDVVPHTVDALRFQHALDHGDTQSALEEWTAAPLAGLEGSGLGPTADALTERWLGALETDLEAQLTSTSGTARDSVESGEVIARLTELTAEHPFREGLWALLMTALYRSGRQAEALSTYRRARSHLVDQLGVEPGPRLRELEAQILEQDAELAPKALMRSSPSMPTGTVTFLFCDVVDSAERWARQPDDMAQTMPRLDVLLREATHRHGGAVFATGGDSFGVAFHRASDAVVSATELQRAVGREPWPLDPALAVRVGVHTGETEERTKGYFGPAVIVAARIAALAHGGQTLVSGTTSALIEGQGLTSLGSYRLDDVVNEQHVLQVGDASHPPLRTELRRRGNLPRRHADLIGREAELGRVIELLSETPIVTIVGPGGIGKTRLAVAAAHVAHAGAFDEVWVVELANYASSDDVARAVASVLELTIRPGHTLLESIVDAIGDRRVLVLLDNCEHVIDGAATVAAAITQGCRRAAVLVTSREGLAVADERIIALAPLDAAGAGAELFIERASAAHPTFDASAHRAAIVEVCRRLDGVPLAIELAAARVGSLAPSDLVNRLDDRLRLLTGGRRTSVERHRTLRATIQWSYDLLDDSEQRLFRQLSIFAGPFDSAAVEAVLETDVETDIEAGVDVVNHPTDTRWLLDDTLGSLVDQSMVIAESGPFGQRFRLLETMRQFGAEHLMAEGQTDTVAQRHASWCLRSVGAIRSLLTSTSEREGVARLDEHWPNLRAAFDWACATGDLTLARALVEPIATEVYVRSRSEIAAWCERLLAITGPDDHDLTVFGLTWAARQYMRTMDRAGFEQLVARHGEPEAPMLRFARRFLEGELPERLAAAEAASAELRASGDDYQADLFDAAGLAITQMFNGELDAATATCHRLVERHRTGSRTCLHFALTTLGYCESARGNHDAAMDWFDHASTIDVPPRTNAMNSPLLARSALRRGQRREAVRLQTEYVDQLLLLENHYLASNAAVGFLALMQEVGDTESIAEILGYLESARVVGGPFSSQIAASIQAIGLEPNDGAGAHTAEAAARRNGRQLTDRGALERMRSRLLALDEELEAAG